MDKPAETAKKTLSASLTSKDLIAKDSDYLSCGITLVNLATYGRVNGGLVKGKIYRVCGRSSSGKTFITRGILAEATLNPNFNGYDLIYDDRERGALMDTKKFYGQKLVDRLMAPARSKKGNPIYSKTTTDFYHRITKKLEEGKKLIWVMDSLDSLEPDAESKMGDGKAKIHSQELRKLLDLLANTGSILILISQAKRDMMGGPYAVDIAAGGTAPEFYSTWEIWLHKAKTLKTKYKGVDYRTGHMISARIKKNRLSGVDRTVYFPFNPSYGIDDVGANIDFLRRAKFWKTGGGTISAPELNFSGSRKDLICKIEEERLETKLQEIVGTAWNQIEDAIRVKRKNKYE